MIRISGVVIPDHKHARISLTYVYGIGVHTAERLCKMAKVDPSKKMNELSKEQVDLLRELVQNERIEGVLRRETQMNIKRLMDIGCFRGQRHRRGGSVRRQRKVSNASSNAKPAPRRVAS